VIRLLGLSRPERKIVGLALPDRANERGPESSRRLDRRNPFTDPKTHGPQEAPDPHALQVHLSGNGADRPSLPIQIQDRSIVRQTLRALLGPLPFGASQADGRRL